MKGSFFYLFCIELGYMTKYAVIDHHSMWGWPKQETTPEEAQIIFVWNDFTIEDDVRRWQSEGKKVICFEHGWNAFFDYEYNKQKSFADGYMALGKNSADSLIRYGIDEKKILVSGNPNFENLKTTEKESSIPAILYTALHWFGERRSLNNSKINKIIETFYPYTDIDVKTNPNCYIDIPKEVRQTWYSEISENRNLFKDIASGLGKYDIILTPKESTFDFIALLSGKKVFRVGKPEEYTKAGEQKTRNILPYCPISTELFFKERELLVNLSDELSNSIDIKKILKWATNL